MLVLLSIAAAIAASTAPRPLDSTPPAYPDAARGVYAPGETVTCDAVVAVDADGWAMSVRFRRCPAPFRDAVRDAVMSWKWAPGTDGEAAVPAEAPLTFTFVDDPEATIATPPVEVVTRPLAELTVTTRIDPHAPADLGLVGALLPPGDCAFRLHADTHGVPERVEWNACPALWRGPVEDALMRWRLAPVAADGRPARVIADGALTVSRPPLYVHDDACGIGVRVRADGTADVLERGAGCDVAITLPAQVPAARAEGREPVVCGVRLQTIAGQVRNVRVDGCPITYTAAARATARRWTYAEPDGRTRRYRLMLAYEPAADGRVAADPAPAGTPPLVMPSDVELTALTVPTWPADAPKAAKTAACGAVAVLGADGVPTDVTFAACDAPFAAAGRDAVLKWRWAPPKAGAVRVPVEVRFVRPPEAAEPVATKKRGRKVEAPAETAADTKLPAYVGPGECGVGVIVDAIGHATPVEASASSCAVAIGAPVGRPEVWPVAVGEAASCTLVVEVEAGKPARVVGYDGPAGLRAVATAAAGAWTYTTAAEKRRYRVRIEFSPAGS